MRIAFTGPESSGKTTLSKWLSTELLDTIYIPEFAREYLEEKRIVRASENDFKEIVKCQCSIFNKTISSDYHIFDTDIFVLRIWNDEVFKLKLPELEILPSYKMDIHFLCAPDVEWVEDALRSASNQDYRNSLFLKYKTELIANQTRFVILNGSIERKKELILESIQANHAAEVVTV
jgi:nicotinamide riboside kinase